MIVRCLDCGARNAIAPRSSRSLGGGSSKENAATCQIPACGGFFFGYFCPFRNPRRGSHSLFFFRIGFANTPSANCCLSPKNCDTAEDNGGLLQAGRHTAEGQTSHLPRIPIPGNCLRLLEPTRFLHSHYQFIREPIMSKLKCPKSEGLTRCKALWKGLESRPPTSHAVHSQYAKAHIFQQLRGWLLCYCPRAVVFMSVFRRLIFLPESGAHRLRVQCEGLNDDA